MSCFLDNMRFHKRLVSDVFVFSLLLVHSSKSKRHVAQKIYIFFNIKLTDLIEIKIEIEIHIIQIIANDFNGFNNLCFRKLFAIF